MTTICNRNEAELSTVVVVTNVLIELYLPKQNGDVVQRLWDADRNWRLPQLWVCEFHHVHFKYLRAGRASNEWFGFSVLDEPGGPAFRYGHALPADRASHYSVDLDGPMSLLVIGDTHG